MENLKVTPCWGCHSAPEYLKIRARFEKSIFLLASVTEGAISPSHNSVPNTKLTLLHVILSVMLSQARSYSKILTNLCRDAK